MNSRKTLLILDDDDNFRVLLKHQLKKLGNYEVLLSNDGDEAIQIIRKNNGKIDLITTDLIHSGIGGIELIQHIKKNFPNIKVLICTGLPQLHEDFAKFSDGILYKPFKFDDFLKVVKVLLGIM